MHELSQVDGLRRVMNRDPVRVIAVTSGKGGVGKTNVAGNIAVSLSGLGKNVMVLDADLGLANIDVLFGLQPRFNLAHVLDGEVDLNSTVLKGPKNVRIVPSASGHQSMIDVPLDDASTEETSTGEAPASDADSAQDDGDSDALDEPETSS